MSHQVPQRSSSLAPLLPLLIGLCAPMIGACGDAAYPAGARAPEPVCPAGSAWNGENCVRALVVTEVSCPGGSRWDGARCVAASEVACPAGSIFVAGQGCVAGAGAVSKVPQQDPSQWQSQSMSQAPAASAPLPAANAKCGCPAGDLMCVMKCTACTDKPTLGCITSAKPAPSSSPSAPPPAPVPKKPF